MQTFSEWEKQCGFMVKDVTDDLLNTEMTEEQFRDYIRINVPGGLPTGVQHDDRIQFLQDNGYEVTRQNMLNPDLHARPKQAVADNPIIPEAAIETPPSPAEPPLADNMLN